MKSEDVTAFATSIIAIEIVIGGVIFFQNQNTEAKLNRMKLDCVEWYKGEITDKELLNKIKMKGDRMFNICSKISEM